MLEYLFAQSTQPDWSSTVLCSVGTDRTVASVVAPPACVYSASLKGGVILFTGQQFLRNKLEVNDGAFTENKASTGRTFFGQFSKVIASAPQVE